MLRRPRLMYGCGSDATSSWVTASVAVRSTSTARRAMQEVLPVGADRTADVGWRIDRYRVGQAEQPRASTGPRAPGFTGAGRADFWAVLFRATSGVQFNSSRYCRSPFRPRSHRRRRALRRPRSRRASVGIVPWDRALQAPLVCLHGLRLSRRVSGHDGPRGHERHAAPCIGFENTAAMRGDIVATGDCRARHAPPPRGSWPATATAPR